jgi:hypothetical protein
MMRLLPIVAIFAVLVLVAACGPAPVQVSVNQPPIPVLDVPTSVKAGAVVHVDASKSTDVDGAVSDAFVLFGDGSDPFILTGSQTFTVDHTFATPGLYLVELYIDDDKHASSRARVRVQVTP